MIAARISGDRLHLQHGPIDLIVGARVHGTQHLPLRKRGFQQFWKNW